MTPHLILNSIFNFKMKRDRKTKRKKERERMYDNPDYTNPRHLDESLSVHGPR